MLWDLCQQVSIVRQIPKDLEMRHHSCRNWMSRSGALPRERLGNVENGEVQGLLLGEAQLQCGGSLSWTQLKHPEGWSRG